MKQVILVVIIALIANIRCYSQFDDKFYFPSKEWNDIENLSYTTMDFLIDTDTINCMLFNSQEKTKGNIIYYHGAGGNISRYATIPTLLCKEGYNVFMIDFRGYGKSTGTPTHLNIANDAQIIIDSISQISPFNTYPNIIFGASIGSQIACKITKENPKFVSALILDGAMLSFTDIALKSTPESQKEII